MAIQQIGWCFNNGAQAASALLQHCEVAWGQPEQFSACREYAELKSMGAEGIISSASSKKTFRLVCYEDLHEEEGGGEGGRSWEAYPTCEGEWHPNSGSPF